MSTTESNKQLVADAFKAWAEGTGTPFDILAEDVDWTITGSCPKAGRTTTKQQFVDNAVTPILGRIPDGLTPTVKLLHADGDWVVVLWEGKGTAADGVAYDNTYSWHLRIADDQVVEGIAFFDGILLADLFERLPE